MSGDVNKVNASIIIPVVSDIVGLERCIRSIGDAPVEIVLALNGASETVREFARRNATRIKSVELPEKNLSAAYNAGIHVAQGKYLLFMDSDCWFGLQTINKLLEAVNAHDIVKGQVQFTTKGHGIQKWWSKLIQQSRSFHTSDHVNAYSPPLIYNRDIIDQIGGYHYNDLIHFREDREFDVRVQLAGIPVHSIPDAFIYHEPQSGFADLRSARRYGFGEAIGRDLGLFLTPTWVQDFTSSARSIYACLKSKGIATAAYLALWLCSFRVGMVRHQLSDPMKVKSQYPSNARPKFAKDAPAVHETKLTPSQLAELRISHARSGRPIFSPAMLQQPGRLCDLQFFPDAIRHLLPDLEEYLDRHPDQVDDSMSL